MENRKGMPDIQMPRFYSSIFARPAGLDELSAFQNPPLFTGLISRTVDERGRVLLTREFREALGDSCYLHLSESRDFISIYPPETWKALVRKYFGDLTPFESEEKEKSRRFAASASFETLDKNGRILLPPQMLHALGIEPKEGTKLVLLGHFNAIEIWTRKRYQQKYQAYIPDENA